MMEASSRVKDDCSLTTTSTHLNQKQQHQLNAVVVNSSSSSILNCKTNNHSNAAAVTPPTGEGLGQMSATTGENWVTAGLISAAPFMNIQGFPPPPTMAPTHGSPEIMSRFGVASTQQQLLLMQQLHQQQQQQQQQRNESSCLTHMTGNSSLILFPNGCQPINNVGSSSASSSFSAAARTTNRSQRCGICRGCQCKPCGVCTYCQDSPQFGGPGVKKQSCIERRCLRVLESRLQRDAPNFKPRLGCNACDVCRTPDCQICLVCLDRRFFQSRYTAVGSLCSKKRCSNATVFEQQQSGALTLLTNNKRRDNDTGAGFGAINAVKQRSIFCSKNSEHKQQQQDHQQQLDGVYPMASPQSAREPESKRIRNRSGVELPTITSGIPVASLSPAALQQFQLQQRAPAAINISRILDAKNINSASPSLSVGAAIPTASLNNSQHAIVGLSGSGRPGVMAANDAAQGIIFPIEGYNLQPPGTVTPPSYPSHQFTSSMLSSAAVVADIVAHRLQQAAAAAIQQQQQQQQQSDYGTGIGSSHQLHENYHYSNGKTKTNCSGYCAVTQKHQQSYNPSTLAVADGCPLIKYEYAECGSSKGLYHQQHQSMMNGVTNSAVGEVTTTANDDGIKTVSPALKGSIHKMHNGETPSTNVAPTNDPSFIPPSYSTEMNTALVFQQL